MTNIHFISHYCERTGPGLWSEPINALTNLAFFAAGLLAWRLYRHNQITNGTTRIDSVILIVLMFCIAIGSSLWHTIARPWAELADSLPILVFISVYLVSFLWRILQLRTAYIILVFALFQLVNNAMIFAVPRDILNGSLFYIPTWSALFLFTGLLWRRHHPAAKPFLTASLLFTAALVFRTIDGNVCSVFPIGSHFIWHLLIATVLYIVFSCLVRYSQPEQAGSQYRGSMASANMGKT